MQCLDSPDDAGRFLPLQSPFNLLLPNDGGRSGSREKIVSPVRIDMELSHLFLDVRLKTNNFQNVSYISGRSLLQTIGKGTGTVLDPTCEHIGNVLKLACSKAFSLEHTLSGSGTKSNEMAHNNSRLRLMLCIAFTLSNNNLAHFHH